ncbi:MAG TPA: signal peptidase I [Nitrospirota bacterium]
MAEISSEARTETRPEAHRQKSFYKEWIEPFLIAAVVALFIRQFVVEAFKIPSGSMIPTLTIGDHLLVNKFIYGPRIPFTDTRFFTWHEPKRGEIIVFKYPENEDKNFIKRVVGLPGDKIEIRDGALFINDQAVRITPARPPADKSVEEGPSFGRPMFYEEQLGTVRHALQYLRSQAGYNYGPITVPAESVFVMGDNRDNSQDSRVWGFVKFNKILGRALVIYWSWDGNDRWARWERIGNLIH